MTNEEAREILKKIEEDGWNITQETLEAIDLAIKALSVDLDERDADAFESGYIVGLSETKKGKWELRRFDLDTGISNAYFCAACGRPKGQIYNDFCASCGADMREADNDNGS